MEFIPNCSLCPHQDLLLIGNYSVMMKHTEEYYGQGGEKNVRRKFYYFHYELNYEL